MQRRDPDLVAATGEKDIFEALWSPAFENEEDPPQTALYSTFALPQEPKAALATYLHRLDH